MKNKLSFTLGLAALTIAACKPNLSTGPASAGPLDLSRYVAVGNSLTAGYSSNSLYKTGQANSYPAILATQFKLVGGGDFKIPYLPGDAGWPSPKLVLGYSMDCNSISSLGPVPFAGPFDTAGSSMNIYASQGPFNNTGVPGIRAIDYILPGYGALNPYAGRIYSNLANTPAQEITHIIPTFFTAWIGNNDVLGYATSGGVGKGSGGSFADQSAISDVNLFEIAVDTVVRRLTASGAKGALMNIPDVTAIPFFTTVPVNGLVLTQTQATMLSAAYAALGIKFAAGANNFIIADTKAPGGLRQAKSDEYILLTIPQDSLKCKGWGSVTPIPAQYVLDETEVANVKTATTTFNNFIQSEATQYKLAYVDMNTYLKTLGSGNTFNGVTFNTTFVTGGAFSLDGVHLTPRGYALAANEMIRTINAYYGSSIPQADVNKYGGLDFP